MKNNFLMFIACIIISSVTIKLSAQTGTEFWFAAPDISATHDANSTPLNLHITAEYATHVRISRPADLSFTPVEFDLNDQQTQSIQLETLFGGVDQIEVYARDRLAGNFVQNKGFLITADPGVITAYYEPTGPHMYNTDIIALKSTNALGKDFWVSTQRKYKNHAYPDTYSGFVVVATKDGTVVNINPNGNNLIYTGTTGYSVTLNKGQTFSARAAGQTPASHIFGIHVTSNKDIAITVFDDSMEMTNAGGSWDLFVDQCVPTNLAGTEYVVIKGNVEDINTTELDGEAIFVTTTQDNTLIFIDGVYDTTIPLAGSYYGKNVPSLDLSGQIAMHIETSKPAFVNHITGYSAASTRELGGAILPPVDNCTGSHSVTIKKTPTPGFYFFNNLIVRNDKSKNDAIYNFKYSINGGPLMPINPNHFTYIMDSSFAFYDRTKAGVGAYYNNVADGQILRIENNIALFHVGVMQGDVGHGCKYGYFSDYASSKFAAGIGGYTMPPSEVLCNFNPIRLVANGATSYKWYTPYDPALVEKLDYDTVAAPYFFPDEEGVFYFNVIMSGACQATDTLQLEAIVMKNAEAVFSLNEDEGCSEFNTTINNLSDPLLNDNMVWRFYGPSSYEEINQDTIPVSFVKYFSVNNTDTTQQFVVTLTATRSGNMCPSTKSDTIRIYPNIHANFIVSETNLCSSLNASILNASLGNISQYHWDSGMGEESTDQNPEFVYNNTQDIDTVYSIRLIVTSAQGCSDTAIQDIKILPAVVYQLVADNWAGCSPFSTKIDAMGAESADSIIWNIKNKNNSIAVFDSLTLSMYFENSGENIDTIKIETIAFNINGCSTSKEKEILIYPPVVADFDYDLFENNNPVMMNTTNNSINATDYNWDFGDGNSSNSVEPLHDYYSTTDTVYIIQLIASNEECSDTMSRSVNIVGFSSLDQFEAGKNIIKIYFNNLNKNLLIDYKGKNSKLNSISIYNISGERVYFNNIETVLEDGVKKIFSINNLTDGSIYIVYLNMDNELFSQKIWFP